VLELSAGDFDGDGFDDLAMRLGLADDDPRDDEWRVIFGRESFEGTSDIGELDRVLRIGTELVGVSLRAIAIVPDVSGDGARDLLLTARRADRAMLAIVEGGPDLDEIESLTIESIADRRFGALLEADADLSARAGSAGDFNGDGAGDVYFAGPGVLQTGAVAVIYGNPILFNGRLVTLRNSFFGDIGGMLIAGPSFFAGLDISASAAGDLDGDGGEELFIRQSDFGGCTLTARADRAIVFDYRGALERMLSTDRPTLVDGLWAGRLVGPPDFYLPSEPAPDTRLLWLENHTAAQAFGAAIAPAGDFDGDGLRDLVIGAPGSSGLTPVRGAAYVLRGQRDLLATARVDFPDSGELAIQLVESPPRSGLGSFVDGGFDWNVDGADDVIVANATNTVYVVLGGEPRAATFVRGDANGDGRLDLSDAVSVLSFLFLGGPGSSCLDALDADDRGSIEITDAIYVLGFLFLGGAPPPPPFPDAGSDPTPDGLACVEF